MSLILKSIFRILTALFLTVTILIAAVSVYWFLSAAPDIETASFVGLILLSLFLTLFFVYRSKKKPLQYQKDVTQIAWMSERVFAIVQMVSILFIAFWWVLPKEKDIFYFATILLFMSYAFVFNEFPVKGLSIIRTRVFRKKHLPALILASSGYLYGFFV